MISVLEQHKEKQAAQRLKVGGSWHDLDLVICGLEGNYLNLRYILKMFDTLLKAAGLPHIRIHDLRHSTATLLLSMGVDMKVIQEILGHSNIVMTADTYTHVSLTMQEDAMDRWNGKLGNEDDGDDDDGAAGVGSRVKK